MNYSSRQTKKTLAIDNLKGVAVKNTPSGKGYTVSFRAELIHNGDRYYSSYVSTSQEAAKEANKLFKSIYGDARAAKKNGYWNSL